MSTWYLLPHAEYMPKAREAALKALVLDETLAEAHVSLALIAENYDYDWETAEKEFRRAIQLNPEYATAHQWYAEYLSWQGRFDEAFAESERARQLDPMSLIIANDRGAIFYYSRQYDRAIQQCQAVLKMDPGASDDFGNARGFIFLSYIEEGKFPEAMEEHRREYGASQHPWVWALKAYAYGRWGKKQEFQSTLKKFQQLAPQLRSERTPAELFAYISAPDKNKILGLLEKAYQERSPALTTLKVDPKYDNFRSEPRFQELLRRMRLAQ
jgi:tetratricopeptide (TPR) repeat protein